MERILHPILPVYNKDSKILILGSFPSVKSREAMFFYGHPQNRFWKVIGSIYDEPIPQTIRDKKEMLLRHHIAIWDVIQSCEITGSADSTIKNVIPNDLTELLKEADIRQIAANGGTAFSLYMKYIYPVTNREIRKLPSTSPANAGYGLERLIEEWSYIRCYTDLDKIN